MEPKTPIEPSAKSLRRFALSVARCLKDGEDNGDGYPFFLECFDATDTLQAFISEARELFGLPDRNDPPEEED